MRNDTITTGKLEDDWIDSTHEGLAPTIEDSISSANSVV
jgi:hypothetical protein